MSYTVCLSDNPYTAVLTPPVRTLPVDVRVQFALHYAVLAPSIHNTQPWRFRMAEDDAGHQLVEVYADLARDLPALDAEHRQLIISCGAAVGALRVALAGLGVRSRVARFPSDAPARCVAQVVALGDAAGPETAADRDLMRRLPGRRTYRAGMSAEPVEQDMRELTTAAEAEGSVLLWVSDPQERRSLERLVARATLTQVESGAVTDELRDWTNRDARSRDGVPADTWRRTSVEAVMAPVVQRDFALGRALPADTPAASAEGEPGLAALCSATDDPVDWLRTGEALLMVLLRAEADGLAVGYVNQPVEVPRLRDRLRDRLSRLPDWQPDHAVPQLLLRVGQPAEAAPPAAPRRPVSDRLLAARTA